MPDDAITPASRNHFVHGLLEMMEPQAAWIPLQFGTDEDSHLLPPDGGIDHIRLRIRSVDAAQQSILRMTQQRELSRSAVGTLYSGATYRLSWETTDNEGHRVRCQTEFDIPAADGPDSLPAANDVEVPTEFYRVEFVYRHSDAPDAIFLGQALVPPMQSYAGIQSVGNHEDGGLIAPPNPGYAILKSAAQSTEAVGTGWTKLARPADSTQSHWARIENMGSDLVIGNSDIGTSMTLPQEIGDIGYGYFDLAIYRVERIDTNIDVLRQDDAYCKSRTTEILQAAALNRAVDPVGRRWAEQGGPLGDGTKLRQTKAAASMPPIEKQWQ